MQDYATIITIIIGILTIIEKSTALIQKLIPKRKQKKKASKRKKRKRS